jgi:hypothetical protein
VQAVSQYVKAIHSYASINSNYPIETLFPCLGSNTPQTTCGNVGGGPICQAGSTVSNATFEANIRTVLSGSLPQPSAQRMTCGTTQTSGAYYNPSTGKTATIIYFLKGDVTCDAIGGVQSISKIFQDESTRCFATLPTLP